MRRRSRVFATGLFMLGLMGTVMCSVVGCRSAVKDFYDPLLVPPCEGAGGQDTSQGGSSSQSASGGMGGSAGAGGECVAR